MARQQAQRSNPERGEETRLRILTSAVPIIARRGGRGISLVEIAESAGVSKTGLLHHFKNKNALLNSVLDARDEVDGYPDSLGTRTGFDILDHSIDEVHRWSARPHTIGVFTALLSENLNEGDPLHERLRKRAEDIRADISRALEAGKARGEIRSAVASDVVAAETIAFLNGLETYWLLDPTVPIGHVAEQWRAAKLRELTNQDQYAADTAPHSIQVI